MTLEVSKICRTCLAMDGPLLSIYDSKTQSGTGCVADMLEDLTNITIKKLDGMPERVCLACICEINRCYSFKMKCDNSDRTLRQLISTNEEPVEQAVEAKLKSEEIIPDKVPVEKRKPQKRKADPSKTEPVDSIESNVNYSLQEDDELEASYFVIHSEEEENEGEQEKRDDGNSLGYEAMLHKYVHQSEEEEKEEKNDNNDDDDEYKPKTSRSTPRKKEELKCPVCPMSFVHPRNLTKHIAKHHSVNEPIQAPLKQDTDMVEVIQVDEVPTPEEEQHDEIELELVPEDTPADEAPQLPTELVELNIDKHRCPLCGAGFAHLRSLNIHIKQKKCTEKQYSCDKCQKVFISSESLRAHSRTHKDESACTICGQVFSNNDELNEHKSVEHNLKAKNQCPICQKAFTMLSTLRDHIRIHSGEKPFVCQTCGKGFSQNANLKQHLMRHNKTKPYKCEECPRSFVSKGELYSHFRSHTGDHPFVCDSCKASFTTSSSLVKHKRIHTGERPYACEFCPMRFTTLNTLKNHRRTHTGEKPFKCKFCQRGFAQKSDCAIHMRTHTGERRYICRACNSAFQQAGTLRAHMKIHMRLDADLQAVDLPEETKHGIVDNHPPDDEDEAGEEQTDEEKKEITTVQVQMGDDDLLDFAFEACSSENNDFSGE